jgi:starch synthase
MSYDVPKMINDQGGQIRILCQGMEILTREDQLHVIRLSGMNLVVNDLDMPLIIKVASIPKEYRFILLTMMSISSGKPLC